MIATYELKDWPWLVEIGSKLNLSVPERVQLTLLSKCIFYWNDIMPVPKFVSRWLCKKCFCLLSMWSGIFINYRGLKKRKNVTQKLLCALRVNPLWIIQSHCTHRECCVAVSLTCCLLIWYWKNVVIFALIRCRARGPFSGVWPGFGQPKQC